MSPKVVEQDGFTLIGIESRTSNTKEMTGEGVIGRQWQRFFQEGMLDKIPHKLDTSIYALYTDYVSNRDGEYSFLIGAKVRDGTAVLPGMVKKKVPKGKYAVLTTAIGPVAKVVPETWQLVWKLEDSSGLGGPRVYKADFEVYSPQSPEPQNAEVDLYIGIR
jgi:predicted transcriptional regulator YdeE